MFFNHIYDLLGSFIPDRAMCFYIDIIFMRLKKYWFFNVEYERTLTLKRRCI